MHCLAAAYPRLQLTSLPRPASPQVLLLEAYEQLERDVGKEVDRALGGQAEELQRLGRRVAFLEQGLEAERGHAAELQQQAAELQEQLGEAQARCQAYESGVYGLPQVWESGRCTHAWPGAHRAVGSRRCGHALQCVRPLGHLLLLAKARCRPPRRPLQAVMEIKQWRAATQAEQLHVKDLVAQLNEALAALEDARDGCTELRQRLGLPEGAALDLGKVKLQKEAAIAQLRSLNALLERQVGRLGR